jgi:hypothetical protein
VDNGEAQTKNNEDDEENKAKDSVDTAPNPRSKNVR